MEITNEMVEAACIANYAAMQGVFPDSPLNGWKQFNQREREGFRKAMREALQAALGAGWRPIAEAPGEEWVWVFDPAQDPQQYVAKLTEGYGGPYWRPAEQLVVEVLDEDLAPTHFMPLPAPPSSTEAV